MLLSQRPVYRRTQPRAILLELQRPAIRLVDQEQRFGDFPSKRTGSSGDPAAAFVDNIRWALIVLVICHHAAVTYSHVGGWYYLDGPQAADGNHRPVRYI